MAYNYGEKIITIDFSDMSGGVNLNDNATDLEKNEVQYALNAVFGKRGFGRCYGLTGLKSSATFATTRGYGIHVYEKSDGTEILLAVSGQKLYSINTTTGAETELYDFGAAGEAYFCNYMGTCFVSNGTKLVKYDGTNAYQVGIAAPSGVTAAAAAGGTLPDGVYQIYVGYARKVSSSNVLYSSGQLITSVTLGTGNNSIAFSSFSNSSDPQVNNKVVWMTDAGGGTFYFFYQTNNNTTTSFTITSTSARDSTQQYDILAAYNFVPSSPGHIFVFDNRLWYINSGNAYFSLQAGTVYDLEKFDTGTDGNVLKFPFTLSAGFAAGSNLCFNTTSGIIVIPNGDISQRYYLRGIPYYFKYINTLDTWNNLAIGVTNDGIKIFDGEKFINVDISYNIKQKIDLCYTTATSTLVPCGKIIRNRKSGRLEYHFSFTDNTISGTLNNRTWVLDLDSMYLNGPDDYNTQWEQWQNGFQYATENKSGGVYLLQSKSGASTVVQLSTSTSADQYIYDEDGTWLSSATNRKLEIISRENIPDLMGFCRFIHIHLFCKASNNVTISTVIGNDLTRYAAKTFIRGETATPIFDESFFDEAVFDYESAIKNRLALNRKMKGNSVYIDITQTANDLNLSCSRIYLTGTMKRTRFS